MSAAAAAGVFLAGCGGSSSTQPSASPSVDSSVVEELARRVPERIGVDGALTFGTDPSFPPMESLTTEGALTGADIALAEAIAFEGPVLVEIMTDAELI